MAIGGFQRVDSHAQDGTGLSNFLPRTTTLLDFVRRMRYRWGMPEPDRAAPDPALDPTVVQKIFHQALDRTVPDPAVEPTVSVERAGVILGLSRPSAYAGVRSGEIPSITVGRRRMVPTAWLARRLSGD
jgi:hypothetical protein